MPCAAGVRGKLPGQIPGPRSYTIHKCRRPSQQFIKAAEEWIPIEDDQEVVEAIRLDCQDDLIGEAADDGECGGGESSKRDGSKRQDSGASDDDSGLADTEGPETLEDLPL